jgi:hypothetical protein
MLKDSLCVVFSFMALVTVTLISVSPKLKEHQTLRSARLATLSRQLSTESEPAELVPGSVVKYGSAAVDLYTVKAIDCWSSRAAPNSLLTQRKAQACK